MSEDRTLTRSYRGQFCHRLADKVLGEDHAGLYIEGQELFEIVSARSVCVE